MCVSDPVILVNLFKRVLKKPGYMRRKGITPVIAVVLLILITVAAVGVVYTQFENIVGSGADTGAVTTPAQTEISFESVYNNDTGSNANNADSINITIRNTGEISLNVTRDLTVSFIPDGSQSGIAFGNYPDTVQSESDCLKPQGGNERIEPGDSYTCKTGIAWPSPSESAGIVISMTGADKSWTRSCAPRTSGTVSC